MERVIGSTTIRVEQADICDLDTEAIVNAANNRFWMGGGVAGAIKRRGGVEIEREAVAQGPVAVGDAVVTKAGALRTRWVIHAAVMGQDLVTDADKIARATASSLRRAEERRLRSIAFPALGTGVGGFPPERAAPIMLAAVRDHISSGTALQLVVFALTPTTFAAFGQALAALEQVDRPGGDG